MSEDKKEMVPIDIGGGEMISPDQMGDMLGGTIGQPSTPLESLSIFNQGKEDYWSFGDDEKCESVLGIFLYSARPMRAFWHPERDMDGSPPTCFSLNGLEPHDYSEEKESEACGDCEWNKLGTAKVGKGKACKSKAADFIIQIPENVEIGEDGVAYVDPNRVLGPALLRYSIANREATAAFSNFLKAAKEKGSVPYPQAVLCRWGWQSAKSKSGVKFAAVKMEAVAPLPSPQDDPSLWAVIMKETKQLKEGQANEILAMLSGSGATEED